MTSANNFNVDILLATFNSAKFLRQQVDSILSQDCSCWRLFIRDGGSSDKTLEMANNYCKQYPEKIFLIKADHPANACENFSRLLEIATADYIMFSDHDDVWHSDKITKSLALMTEAEHKYGGIVPIMLFSDKIVVDENLNVIANSYFQYQKINPYRLSLNYILLQNVPNGCTMLLNRALARIAQPIPVEAVMHDHWITLCAAAMGNIIYLKESTLLYRQHANNVFGARRYGLNYLLNKVLGGIEPLQNRFLQNLFQAKCFLERYKNNLDSKKLKLLEDFVELHNACFIRRYHIIFRRRILKNGFGRNLGLFLMMLFPFKNK